MLWPTKDWSQREQHSTRTIIEFDNATKCRFAPDSNSVIVAAAAANTIQAWNGMNFFQHFAGVQNGEKRFNKC
jgi:hypothetical protein